MANKNRKHVNFRVNTETDKTIKKYAKRMNISEGRAVDELIASAIINANYAKQLEGELKQLTNNSPAF